MIFPEPPLQHRPEKKLGESSQCIDVELDLSQTFL